MEVKPAQQAMTTLSTSVFIEIIRRNVYNQKLAPVAQVDRAMDS